MKIPSGHNCLKGILFEDNLTGLAANRTKYHAAYCRFRYSEGMRKDNKHKRMKILWIGSQAYSGLLIMWKPI